MSDGWLAAGALATSTDTGVDRVAESLVALTVAVNVPGSPLHVTVKFPYPGSVALLSVHPSPDGTATCRVIAEVKPFFGVIVIVVLPEEPVWKLMGPLDDMVKYGQMLLSTIPIAEPAWRKRLPLTLTVAEKESWIRIPVS